MIAGWIRKLPGALKRYKETALGVPGSFFE